MKVLASAIALAVVLAGSPTPARAQAGWYVTPSFSLTEEYDDNVFATPSEEREDFITRFSPGLKAGFRSVPLTLEASSSFDAEVYAKNPELSGAANRKRARLEFKYLPTPVATLGLGASYIETQTPTELLEETGVELGRRDASLLAVAPSLSYRFSPVTSGEAGYSFTRGRLEGGPTNTTQEAHLLLAHHLTSLHTAALGYRFGLFESDLADSRASHTVTLGWTGRLAQHTTLTLQAGPRISDGTVDPEVLARLEQRFAWGAVSLAYTRSEAVVLGRAGTVRIDGVIGSLTLEPLQSLRVSLVPSVRKSSEEDPNLPETTVYGVSAAISYRIARWVAARVEYRFSLQEEGPVRIRHNVASISLDFDYPLRLGE